MATNAGELRRTDAIGTSIPVWSTARIFVLALGLQLFHLLEHVVQVAQGKFLGLRVSFAQMLVFALMMTKLRSITSLRRCGAHAASAPPRLRPSACRHACR